MLLIDKADKATESSGRTPQQKAAITRLKSEMTDAGILQRGYTLQPSKNGKRLEFTDHKLQIFDGPFAESKELIGGFAVLELSGLDGAIEVSEALRRDLGRHAPDGRPRSCERLRRSCACPQRASAASSWRAREWVRAWSARLTGVWRGPQRRDSPSTA